MISPVIRSIADTLLARAQAGDTLGLAEMQCIAITLLRSAERLAEWEDSPIPVHRREAVGLRVVQGGRS